MQDAMQNAPPGNAHPPLPVDSMHIALVTLQAGKNDASLSCERTQLQP